MPRFLRQHTVGLLPGAGEHWTLELCCVTLTCVLLLGGHSPSQLLDGATDSQEAKPLKVDWFQRKGTSQVPVSAPLKQASAFRPCSSCTSTRSPSSALLRRKCQLWWGGARHTKSQKVNYSRTHAYRNLWTETPPENSKKADLSPQSSVLSPQPALPAGSPMPQAGEDRLLWGMGCRWVSPAQGTLQQPHPG